jgi:hypothetical protein
VNASSWIKLTTLVAICATAAFSQVRAQTLYSTAYNGSGGGDGNPGMPATLYTVNQNTGAATPVGAVGFNQISAIDFSLSGTLYGIGINPNNTYQQVLITINPSTGVGTEVGVTGIDPELTVTDMSFRSDDTLFGYSDGNIYTFSLATGAATELGSVGDGNPEGNGLAFSPFDALYKADNANLWTINQTTGAGTVVADMNYPFDDNDRINAMKFNDTTGVLFASVKGNGVSGPNNYLATVDVDNGNVTEIGQTMFGTSGLAFTLAMIPEPGAFTLVGVGLVGLLALWRRRK